MPGHSLVFVKVPRWIVHRRQVLLLLALACATAITYANSLSNGFHYDDWHGIVRNPAIKDLANIPSYFIDPSTFSLSHHDDWRPILQITYALNFYFGGLDPTNFRIFNLLIHIASAVLIYAIVIEVHKNHDAESRGGSPPAHNWIAAAAAFLFALHPANSEVVNYIWARSSSLAAFFYLLGFYCFLRAPIDQAGRSISLWHMGALGAYVLGLGTKATAVTLPAALLGYEFLRRQSLASQKQSFRAWFQAIYNAKKYVPMIIIGLTYLALRIILLPDSFGRVVDTEEITRTTYLLSSFHAWVHYLTLFFWPSPLLVNSYAFGWSRSFWDAEVLRALGTAIVLLIWVWKLRKSEFIITVFTFWFFLTLLPEQSFLPLSEPINGYRPYLAYAGLSVAIPHLVHVGWLALMRIDARYRIVAETRRRLQTMFSVATIILMITLAFWTSHRNRDWRDERTLWSDVARKDPSNPRAQLSLGLEFLQDGNYSNAQKMFEKAIALAPKNGYAHLLRGYLHQLSDQDNLALESYSKAVEINPRSTHALYYRGELLSRMGRYPEAIKDFERVLRLKHYFTDARYSLALAYLKQQDLTQGEQHCKLILKVDRRDVRAYQCLGRILMEQRDFESASRIYERGLAFLPANQELWRDLSLTYAARGMFGPALAARQKSITFASPSPN